MFLFSRVWGNCDFQGFLARLVLKLSHILRAFHHPYQWHKNEMRKNNPPMAVRATEAESRAICFEIAEEVYRGRLVLPLPLITKDTSPHRGLETLPSDEFHQENKQTPDMLYSAAFLWEQMQLPCQIENYLQTSNEIIQGIYSAYSKLSKRAESSDRVLYDNGDTLNKRVSPKIQNLNRQQCPPTCPYLSMPNSPCQPKGNDTASRG